MIHHSATRDGQWSDWEAIRRYHRDKRGWDNIGYHYGLEMVDGDYRVRYGRPPYVVGAHTKGRNTGSLGICILGNYSQQQTGREFALAQELVRALMVAFGIAVWDVYGHMELMEPGYTDCPGRNWDLGNFRIGLGQ